MHTNITLLFIVAQIRKHMKYLLSTERYIIAYPGNTIVFVAKINSNQTMRSVY